MDYINTLPNELLSHIFGSFSYKQQYILGSVCHKWYDCIHMVGVYYPMRYSLFMVTIDDLLADWNILSGIVLTCKIVCAFDDLTLPIARYRFMTDSSFCEMIDRRCSQYYECNTEIAGWISKFYLIFDGRSEPSSGPFDCCSIM